MSRKFTSAKGQRFDFLWLKLVAAYPNCNSEVYIAKCRQTTLTGTTEPFIVKYISEHAPFDEEKKKRYEKLTQLQHCNIVKYFSYGEDTTDLNHLRRIRLCSLQEYCSGGTLASHCSTVNLTENDIALYAFHILDGLGYLHSQNIIHGNLKGDSIVLTSDKTLAKICDLDGSVVCVNTTNSRESSSPEKIGKFCFMPSEILAHGDRTSSKVGRKTDIWSVGCVTLQMLGRGEFYFRDQPDNLSQSVKNREEEYQIMVKNGGRPDIPKTVSPELQIFLEQCLERNPNLRPMAWDLIESDFLKSQLWPPLPTAMDEPSVSRHSCSERLIPPMNLRQSQHKLRKPLIISTLIFLALLILTAMIVGCQTSKAPSDLKLADFSAIKTSVTWKPNPALPLNLTTPSRLPEFGHFLKKILVSQLSKSDPDKSLTKAYLQEEFSWSIFNTDCNMKLSRGFYKWELLWEGKMECSDLTELIRTRHYSRRRVLMDSMKNYLKSLSRRKIFPADLMIHEIHNCNCGFSQEFTNELVLNLS